ncbi:MAG TPA: alkaline phosphatase PafA [Flavitalea sp.]|nr:alkaline phosphatase PafA [Flavitalea sp.]
MVRSLFFRIILLISLPAFSQTTNSKGVQRPKLVVGIVVDQMRWDFLYRFYDRYSSTGGFKRMMNQGFNCENTLIPYAPTITACGHAAIYTGSVPAVHGISGNAWWDRLQMRSVYCTEDKTVRGVGSQTPVAGEQSPRNMLVTTICDEMKFASNFKSKVIGIAIKDRGSILPAGHSADAAYWYDSQVGKFITSNYYMTELPQWVNAFNDKRWPDILYRQNWNTLYPISTYVQSTADEKNYESKPFGATAKGFPYDLSGFIEKNYGAIATTPHGNTLTFEMAKAAIEGEQLGKDAITDFLTLSFSSPDYIGHSFGPNSIEIEDNYLRLDKTLGDLLNYLDTRIGKGQYLLFLSADHGVSPIPGFLQEKKLPGGTINESTWMSSMNAKLKELYGIDKAIVSMYNYQVHLDHRLIDSLKGDEDKIKNYIVGYLSGQKGVSQAYDISRIMQIPINEKIRARFANGYFPSRNGDVQIILQPNYMEGGATGTTHGSWYPYDAHIPLLFYGWNIKPGKTNREVYMTDIAPTLAALLKIQMPSGTVGDVITEIVR